MWAGLFTFGGYYFGELKFVQDHFSLVLLTIIIISFIPVIIHFARDYFLNNKNKKRTNKKITIKINKKNSNNNRNKVKK